MKPNRSWSFRKKYGPWALVSSASAGIGAVNKFLYISGKYFQPRTLNTFSFGQVFRRVLRHKIQET